MTLRQAIRAARLVLIRRGRGGVVIVKDGDSERRIRTVLVKAALRR
jgi:hypothetical protein